jgi:hypothetical protein
VSRFRRNVGSFWKTLGLAVIFLLTGCKSDPVWITSNLVPEVRLISDSLDVQALILAQEKSDADELRWLREPGTRDEKVKGVDDRRRHPERYSPTLASFIEAMTAKPGFAVRGGTACRLLRRSQARCTPHRLDTYAYVKVLITEGPNRGQEGWACEIMDVVGTTRMFF